jgi:diketogulonate reductase-like aldo/keto reductase
MANINISMPTLTLNDGHKIPQLAFGIGTALAKGPGDSSKLDKEVVENIKTAIAQGYRHLDTAEMYGNEEELGKAIKESKVKRDEFFITTKVEKSKGDIPAALDASLKRLGLDYVDL